MKRLWRKWYKVNNKGSALLTVLLFVMFLTILATTLLYVSGMNFIIKQADYQNKKNFYTGETTFEEIKANLMKYVVSEAAQDAYIKTSIQYGQAGNSSDAADLREIKYNEYFTEAVCDHLKSEMERVLGPGTYDWSSYLSQYKSGTSGKYNATYATVEVDSSSVKVESGTNKFLDETSDLTTNGHGTLLINELKGIVTLHGVKVTYVDQKTHVATIITTDLELYAPQIDWDATESLETFRAEDLAADGSYQRARTNIDVTRCVRYTNWVKQ